jgi:lipopolysaccharide assembly outer membrane protein LptD (OstA)
MTLTSCSLFKSEDKKASEALVGKFEEEPETKNENVKAKMIYEFEKNGEFTLTVKTEARVEIPVDVTSDEYYNSEYDTPPTPEPTRYETKKEKVTYSGTWEVKDMSLKLKATDLKLDSEMKTLSKKEKERELKDFDDTKIKIVSFDEKKIVLKDEDGNKHTLTKSKD